MRVPLLSGAYHAKSLIASAQRCINLFPEANPDQQAPVPVTHYQTPGLRLLKSPPPRTGRVRCVYTASNGDLYTVIGPEVFYVDNTFAHTSLGLITDGSTPVSMADNGLEIAIVDGSPLGWQVDMATRILTSIVDPNFYGGDKVQYIDTYFAFNRPGTNQWYLSDSMALTFDPLYLAAKAGSADPLQSVIALKRELYLIGTLTTEIWANTGAPDFPFEELKGTFIQHGCAAKYSAAAQDTSIFWLSQDKEGNCVVLRVENYQANRVSTHGVEAEFQSYSRVDDAIGFCYQIGGHAFYDLVFPSADITWSYELKTGQWHQKAFTDGNGLLRRHRANCATFAYGTNIVGDWQNGQIYALDRKVFTDNGNPITRIRTFPHILDDGSRIRYDQFIVDIEVGTITDSSNPEVSLRWSDTRGKSYGNPIKQSMGKTGEYIQSIQFNRLGIARDRVFEVSWSCNLETTMNGAFIDFKKLGN